MTTLEIGQFAPAFTGKDQHDQIKSLKDYSGKKVLLFFYPKDNTPGCTAEACNLQENYDFWKKKGYEIVGISPDSVASHAKFAEKFGFAYTLIADPGKEILTSYGVYGPKMMYGKEVTGVHRTTFLLDEEGRITHIFKKVQTKDHTNQMAKSLEV